MEEGELVLAVDVGSSALKAVVFNREGHAVAAVARPLATRSGADREQEQDAETWWAALAQAVSALPGRDRIGAITLAGTMQNLVAVDEQARALSPVALYSDRRLDESEVAALKERLPPDYATRVGNPLDAAHAILKLTRVERFAPNARKSTARFHFGAKDVLAQRLTGRAAIDPTGATTTGLMDLRARRWDPELLALAGVTEAQLPEILPGDAILGPLAPEAARLLGLRPHLPVVNGAGDAGAATWGADADAPGRAYLYLGTTGWVAATLPLAEANPPRQTYTLADPVRGDRVTTIAPFLTAGAALDWLAQATASSVDALLTQAQAEDAAPPNLLFLPYLAGERSPFEDQSVRGAFLGLDRRHGPGALAYAVLEGVAFAARHNRDALGISNAGQPMTVIGGAARHPLQGQILADAFGHAVRVPDEAQETTALGALKIAAEPLGLQLAHTQTASPVLEPRPERAARHQRRFETYLAASRFARDAASSL